MVSNFATEYYYYFRRMFMYRKRFKENIKNDIFGVHACVCHVCIMTGLEYKFMIKSVDPDETTSVTEKKNEPDDVLVSHNRDLHEEGMGGGGEEVEEHGDQEGETSSPAPVILEDNRTVPNRTGNINYFNLTHRHKELFGLLSKPMGQTHRCLKCHNFQNCSVVPTTDL